jgi:hypothetical protein
MAQMSQESFLGTYLRDDFERLIDIQMRPMGFDFDTIQNQSG